MTWLPIVQLHPYSREALDYASYAAFNARMSTACSATMCFRCQGMTASAAVITSCIPKANIIERTQIPLVRRKVQPSHPDLTSVHGDSSVGKKDQWTTAVRPLGGLEGGLPEAE